MKSDRLNTDKPTDGRTNAESADGNTRISRRRFVKFTTACAMAAGAATPGALFAAELTPLAETDPTAKALGYVDDANSVDGATRGGAERNCSNCRFYTQPDVKQGPCTLFPGKSVALEGWCRAWAQRA